MLVNQDTFEIQSRCAHASAVHMKELPEMIGICTYGLVRD